MAISTTLTTIKVLKNTAAYWAANDPVIADGYAAHSTDTGALRIGDGNRHWSQLSDFNASAYLPVHGQRHAATGDDPITAAMIGAANVNHSHSPDVTKEDAGVAATLIATHANATDPHPQYLTAVEADISGNIGAALTAHVAAGNPHTQYALVTHTHSDLLKKTDGVYALQPVAELRNTNNYVDGQLYNRAVLKIGSWGNMGDGIPALGFERGGCAWAIYIDQDGSLKAVNHGGSVINLSTINADTLNGQRASAFALATHTHPTDASREAAGTAATLLSDHLNAGNPHTQYTLMVTYNGHLSAGNPHPQYAGTAHTHDYYNVTDTRQLGIIRNGLNDPSLGTIEALQMYDYQVNWPNNRLA